MGNTKRPNSGHNGGKRPSPAPGKNGGKNLSQSQPSSNAQRPANNAMGRTSEQNDQAPQPKLSFWARLFGGKKKSDRSIDEIKLDNYRKAIQKMELDCETGTMTAAQLMELLLSRLTAAYEKTPAQQETGITGTIEFNAQAPEETVPKSEYDSLSRDFGHLKVTNTQLQNSISLLNQEKDQWDRDKENLESQIQELKQSATSVKVAERIEPKELVDTNDTGKANGLSGQETNKLQAELEGVKVQLAEAKESNRKLNEQNEKGMALLIKAKERCEAMSSLESKLKDSEKAYTDLQTKKNELDGQIDSLKKELESAKSDIQAARNEQGGAQQEAETLREEIVKLNAEIEVLKDTDTGRLQAEIEALKTEKDSLDQSIDELKASHEAEIQTKLAEIDEKQKQIDALSTTISEKEKQIDDRGNTIEELKTTVVGLNEKVAEKEALIKEKESDISGLNKTVKLLNDGIATLTAEKEDFADRIQQQEASLKEKEQTIASKVKDIAVLNSEVEELKSQVQQLEVTVDRKEKEIEKGIEEIASKENELRASNAEISKSLETAAKSVNGYAAQIMKLLDEGGYELGFGEMADTCEDDEAATCRYFGRIVRALNQIDLSPMRNTLEYLEAVSKVLETDLELGMEGIILPLARTCAYGRLPFMRDDRGEDNMRLDGAKLTKIASGLNALLAQVGIELIVPVPFADKIDEGDYEDGQGNVPNLDYICPNSRSHLDRVDRDDVSGIVTDIIRIGYRKGDKTVKALVLK